VLYNVCKEQNPNSYFISNTNELDKGWFSQDDRVGICGATSTPMWLMEEVKDTLLAY
jgi:4-hydroxy-3-methylbut-2-enyl diphosphate reductase